MKNEGVKFKDLAIGDQFAMDKGVESGLLSDIGHAGSVIYQKVSSKRYAVLGDLSSAIVIGSVDFVVFAVAPA